MILFIERKRNDTYIDSKNIVLPQEVAHWDN